MYTVVLLIGMKVRGQRAPVLREVSCLLSDVIASRYRFTSLWWRNNAIRRLLPLGEARHFWYESLLIYIQ